MALAILKDIPSDGAQKSFEIQIGSNRFYQLVIGNGDTIADQGVKRMSDPKYVQSIQGPISPSTLGRLQISIPRNLLDHENRYVQLRTFMTKEGRNPGYSEILPVVDYQTNAISFSTSNNETNMENQIRPAYNKEFYYKNEIPQAEAMGFLQELGKIAQAVLPAIGGIITDKRKEEGKEAGAEKLFQNKELLDLILGLFAGAGKKGDKAKAASLSASFQQDPKLARAMFAQFAQIIPAIAEAAKSPDMWNGLNKFHQSSLDFINELFGGKLTDFSTFGDDQNNIIQQIMQQDAMEKMAELQLALLEARNKAQSQSLSNVDLKNSGLDFLRVDAVKIYLPGTEKSHYNHMASITFNQFQDAKFSVAIKTPKPISKALLKVSVKPLSKAPVLEKKEKLYNLGSGVIKDVVFSAEELEQLHSGEEYYLSVRLIWPNKNGVRIGTSISRLIMFTGALNFQRVLGSTGEVIPLNDVAQHRPYWHKIWAETLTKRRREISLDVKYYATLDPDDDANGRMETVSKIDHERGNKFEGKMKSGMDYSPEALNDLLPLISDYPKLSDEELEALKNTNFQNYFTKVARKKILFKGKPGESYAMWAYPEMEIHKIELTTQGKTDENTGVVEEQESRFIHFPIPTKVHFIGAKYAEEVRGMSNNATANRPPMPGGVSALKPGMPIPGGVGVYKGDSEKATQEQKVPGRVMFKDVSEDVLRDQIRVIPEEAGSNADLIIPEPDVWYETDGYWLRGKRDGWFKIPDNAVVEVRYSADENRFFPIATKFNMLFAPSWVPDGKTWHGMTNYTHITDYPF